MKRIALTWNDTVLKGESYLFASYDGAMRQSKKVTTNPKVKTVQNKYGREFYIALGDVYENENGKRQFYAYGKGGVLLTVVNI